MQLAFIEKSLRVLELRTLYHVRWIIARENETISLLFSSDHGCVTEKASVSELDTDALQCYSAMIISNSVTKQPLK